MIRQRVNVAVRIRPLVESEKISGAENIVHPQGDNRVVVDIPARITAYDFDWAFGVKQPQEKVYNELCSSLLENVFGGVNATILAYGQTGSGKTHTMGNISSTDLTNDDNNGIIPRVINDLFSISQSKTEPTTSVEIAISYMEVYMEECFDLLDQTNFTGSSRKKLHLKETVKGETIVEGLKHVPIKTAKETNALIAEATQNRKSSATAMNAQSSRSHAICTFTISTTKSISGNANKCSEMTDDIVSSTVTTVAKLNLVDLAGSERVKKTGAKGDTLLEGISINKGLLALGNVIAALSDKSVPNGNSTNSHIPYRDSKITRLLKDSLGGNAMTLLIACVSPADTHGEETLNTLRFASRAMTVVNQTTINSKETHVSSGVSTSERQGIMLKEIEQLRKHVQTLELKCNLLTAGGDSAKLSSGHRLRLKDSGDKSVGVSPALIQTVSGWKDTLVRCIEDGIVLEDIDIKKYRAAIKFLHCELSNTSGAPRTGVDDADAGDGNVLDFILPPIMQLIEEIGELEAVMLSLKKLEGSLVNDSVENSLVSVSANSNEDSVANDETDGCNPFAELSTESLIEMVENDMKDYETEDIGMDEAGDVLFKGKEQKVNEMVALVSQFEGNIGDLKNEVNQLQQEKLRLFTSLKNAPSSSSSVIASKPSSSSLHTATASSHARSTGPVVGSHKGTIGSSTARSHLSGFKKPVHSSQTSSSAGGAGGFRIFNDANQLKQDQIKAELSKKTKALDEKLKELRKKESELNKISLEKKNAVNEMVKLKDENIAAKKHRVELARQVKQEKRENTNEKKKFQMAAELNRRKECANTKAMNKLETELMKKEKVWKGQLEGKEREAKKLQELIKKQEKGKEHRENMKKQLLVAQRGASRTCTTRSDSHKVVVQEQLRTNDIKNAVKEVILKEKLAITLKQEMDIEMKLRTKASKELFQLRKLQPTRSTDSAHIALLAAEVKRRSGAILSVQGALADLGTLEQDGERFAFIESLDDSQIALDWMFAQVTHQHSLQQTLMGNKLTEQAALIAQLQEQLEASQGATSSTAQFSTGSANVTTLPHTDEAPKDCSDSGTCVCFDDDIEDVLDTGVPRLHPPHFDSEENDTESDTESEYNTSSDEGDSEGSGDEEASDSDEDYEEAPKKHELGHKRGVSTITVESAEEQVSKKVRVKKTHCTNKAEASSSDPGDEVKPTVDQVKSEKPREKAIVPAELPRFLNEDTINYKKITMNQLKDALRYYQLPVSGKKDDLIARLEEHRGTTVEVGLTPGLDHSEDMKPTALVSLVLDKKENCNVSAVDKSQKNGFIAGKLLSKTIVGDKIEAKRIPFSNLKQTLSGPYIPDMEKL